MVESPAKIAPLIAAAAGGGGGAFAGAAAGAVGGAEGAAGLGQIMNMAGKSKSQPAKDSSKIKFYTKNEDSYYGE